MEPVRARVDHKIMFTKEYQKRVESSCTKMAEAMASKAVPDWQSFSWKEVKIKRPIAPRQLHTAVEYKDCMYVYGGFGATQGGKCFDKIEVFDFARQKWAEVETKGITPPGRHSHISVVYQDDMWVFGGISNGQEMDDLWRFNFPSKKWVKVNPSGNSPSPRWGHSACIFKKKLYIFGGLAKNYTNELWEFNFVAPSINSLQGVTLNFHLGALHEPSSVPSFIRHYAHLAKSSMKLVKTKGDTPLPRQFHSTVVYDDSLYLYGGYNDKKKWIKLQDSEENEGRRGASSAVTGHWMAIHAGRDRAWEKNLDSDTSSCSARYFHSLCLWRGMLCLFGGLGLNLKSTTTKPIDLNDMYLLGSGLANMVERVDDSSMSDIDAAAVIVNKKDKQKEEDEKKAYQKLESIETAKKKRFIRHHGFIGLLPRELKLYMASFLNYESLANLGGVNKEWYLIGLNEALWEEHVYAWALTPVPATGWQMPTETNNLETYVGYKSEFEKWMTSMHVDASFWKDKMVLHSPASIRGYAWTPPSRPNDDLVEICNSEFKLMMLGGGGVGKSAMTIRYIGDHFIDEYDPTIEDSYKKQVKINDTTVLIDILDTAGPEEYSAMRDLYMRTGQGFLLCYSVTSRMSFEEIRIYIDQILRVKDCDTAPMVLVGNKCDLWTERQVSQQEGLDLAKSLHIPFLETSALSGTNINEVFARVVLECELVDVNPSMTPKKEEKCSVQ